MAYSPMSRDLDAALSVLKAFGPYSGHPSRVDWQKAMELAEDVHAQLSLIERYRPGLLRQLADTAYDEAQIQSRPMIKEIRELVGRYTKVQR